MSDPQNAPHANIAPREYSGEFLDESFGEVDPLDRFNEWFSSAIKNGVIEPDACVLSTYDGEKVNARTVALRGVSAKGFLIYTNYNSFKAHEIGEHHDVALTFYFREQFRQIRIRGAAKKTTSKQSDEYFASRPRGSQVGAWVSRQSQTLSSRDELNKAYQQFDSELGDVIERPPFWGGYEIIPAEYEFMQGHESRLHDRFKFVFNDETKKFDSQRLWP